MPNILGAGSVRPKSQSQPQIRSLKPLPSLSALVDFSALEERIVRAVEW